MKKIGGLLWLWEQARYLQFGHLQNIEDLLMHYAIEVFEHYGKKCSVEIEKSLVSTVGNRARFR